jgi:hypothetical protein
MKRDELLIPGSYCSLPKVILASKAVTASAKLVAMAILDRIGNNLSSWPGYRTIEKDTGVCRNTAIDAVKQIETLGIFDVNRSAPQDRESNRYSLRPMEQWAGKLKGRRRKRGNGSSKTELPSAASEPPLGSAKSEPPLVQGVNHPSAKAALPPSAKAELGVVQRLNPNYRKEQPQGEPPQEPQQLTTPPGGATASQSSQGEATVTLDESDELNAPAPTPALTPKAYASQMIKQASKAGLEMPKTEEALRPCHANLVFCVQENPIIPFLWISIVRFLVNRKGFASKSLKWITSYKTQEDGSRLFNWQMVVQWMLAADAGCLFHSINFHWQTENFTPIHGRLADKYYDVRDKLAGKIIPRPKTLEMHPFWNSHLYLFAGSGPKRGQYCKLSTFRGNTVVEFEDGEKYVDFQRSDLLDYDAKLPPLPSQNTPQEDQLLAGLIAA